MSIQSTTGSRSWLLRGSAELFVIVVGVLLALSLDNWWAERQERSLEAEYIEGLNREARSQIEALGANQVAHSRKHASLTAAARLLDEPFVPEKTPNLVHGLLQGSGIPVVPQFSTAVFLDLQSSGRLRLIRDESLRLAVIEHYARIPAQLQRAQRWAAATNATLHAFISGQIPVGSVRQEGPILSFDWSGLDEAELHELGTDIHGHADIQRYVNAQARLLEEERNWLDILIEEFEEYARLFGE